jgi:hypothetical protein
MENDYALIGAWTGVQELCDSCAPATVSSHDVQNRALGNETVLAGHEDVLKNHVMSSSVGASSFEAAS